MISTEQWQASKRTIPFGAPVWFFVNICEFYEKYECIMMLWNMLWNYILGSLQFNINTNKEKIVWETVPKKAWFYVPFWFFPHFALCESQKDVCIKFHLFLHFLFSAFLRLFFIMFHSKHHNIPHTCIKTQTSTMPRSLYIRIMTILTLSFIKKSIYKSEFVLKKFYC